jgi:DNA mismatch repair protein MutS
VARLAGIPDTVVKRASVLLQGLTSLETGEAAREQTGSAVAMRGTPEDAVASQQTQPEPLAQTAPVNGGDDALRMFLRSIEPDQLSPRDALELIYDIVKSAQSSNPASPEQWTTVSAKKSSRKKQWDASGLPSLF